MNSLVKYAKSELEKIPRDSEGMQERINKHVIEIIEVFSQEGHSGSSAMYTVAVLERLLRYLPLTPLTGEDDEWEEVTEGTWQNKRCSKVFKNKDGQAYNIEGKIFSDDGGETWHTNKNSRVDITFPYVPPTHPEMVVVSE